MMQNDFNDADVSFVTDMIPHHQAAVEMARQVLSKGENPEIAEIAEGIVSAQSGEIEVLQDWLASRGLKQGAPMKMGARGSEKRVEREIRNVSAPIEVRAEGDGIRVTGYAAVFNREADIGGLFREIIAPGAFTEAISRDDVVFLINHAGLPLARTRSGTLQLSQDSTGLRMETYLEPSDPDVGSIVPKMKRGDLDKMSFAFSPEVEEWDETDGVPVRTLKKLRLYDVSIVTTPAYEGTSIAIRALEQHRKLVRLKNFSAAARRVRMKMNLRLRGAENG